MDSLNSADEFPLVKIVSGGQTGVDRAALDTAILLDIEHGGWCPAGRRAEDGVIDTVYQLTETPEWDYAVRTERNVIDSDGTLILCRGRLSGGTLLTERLVRKYRRPHLVVDLSHPLLEQDFSILPQWIRKDNIRVLNVAGPRESSSHGITQQAENFLVRALS